MYSAATQLPQSPLNPLGSVCVCALFTPALLLLSISEVLKCFVINEHDQIDTLLNKLSKGQNCIFLCYTQAGN